MCTAITLASQPGEQFFGRTMDFSHNIEPKLFIVPESFTWYDSLTNQPMKDTYRFIGLGQEVDGLLGFFDGVNERGFAAAVLYFAGFAEYGTPDVTQTVASIASIDFLHYILGKCSSVNNLYDLLQDTKLVGIVDPITNTVAPLHWIAADKTGACVVIEGTERGLEVINNPIGVMANSPDFRWHMTNLRNYMNVTPVQTEEITWENVQLTPFGQAGGTFPLPGGYTSPERFIRASYLKSHIPTPSNRTEAIVACFHIMESVSIPKGAVITNRNTYDYTKYTAFMNINTGEYYYKTYDDMQIRSASLWQRT